MRVLICGGGAIGASIAYCLSRRRIEAVVVERTGVACAASGKSGGFLALDWCDGSPLAPLARRSFALHAELAAAFPGKWGYRRLDTSAIAVSARRGPTPPASAAPPDWIAHEAVLGHQRLGDTATTAQVDPAGGSRGGCWTRPSSAAPGSRSAASQGSRAAPMAAASPARSSMTAR